MKYRKVGKSGLKISEISIGTWITYGGTVEDEMAKKCLAAAIESGINFIDSAEIYEKGGAEKIIADFLSDETYDRKDLVISSKVFWPMSEGINNWGLGRKNISNAIEGTLKRLNMDYIDIYFMHRYDYMTPLRETVEILDDLIRAGKVRYWGTSAWTAAQLERANALAKDLRAHKPIVEQPLYNMLFRHIEMEIMSVAKTHGMGFTVWSPLAQGLLTGKYNEGIPEDSRAFKSEMLKKRITEENIEKVKKLTEIAKSIDITIGQLALAWILRRPEISCAIIGATKPEHVNENVKASDVTLSNDILNQIDIVLDNEPEWPLTYKPNYYYTDKMR
ncbi:MAG: aldo/keto reductase family protein [Candidatus Heimdallarchaeota archaeon]|nr:aldo/keto reductase family protein [Candidatus Heimdallarchaeota archaeon]MCK4955411.1 aldo/keto reductase family protein [Candidatus Heimdallarchaeota archaeon]